MGAFALGGWAICRQLLPALRILETVELWPHPFRILDTAAEEPTVGLITLAGLCVAGLIAGVTWFCERTLPELLDVLVLSRTRLDPGARYAVATVCRYAVLLLGTLATFQQLGIGWAQLNWLVAAMTVGLGFGLQEIFANFISGLILLFERPIRVGDTLTVGDTNGVVTRIRIRATTVVDGSRKELVIPNKEFITGKIVNWTLSDRTLKGSIPVSVSHDSNVQQVLRILTQAADRHPLVLKDPAPKAVLEGFADGLLKFNLSFFVGNLDNMGSVRHELTTAVEQALREAHEIGRAHV